MSVVPFELLSSSTRVRVTAKAALKFRKPGSARKCQWNTPVEYPKPEQTRGPLQSGFERLGANSSSVSRKIPPSFQGRSTLDHRRMAIDKRISHGCACSCRAVFAVRNCKTSRKGISKDVSLIVWRRPLEGTQYSKTSSLPLDVSCAKGAPNRFKTETKEGCQ